MRKLFLSFVLMLVLILVALVAVPPFIPADVYKEQIISKVEAATGRRMAIDGSVGLRIIPRLRVNMEQVRLENPDGFLPNSDEPMISLSELQVSVAFFRLLQGEVVIEQFKLVEPTIRLARNAKGEVNWEFTPKDGDISPRHQRDASTGNATESPQQQLQLPHLEIQNGAVSYQATPDADVIGLDKLNLHLRLPSLHRTAQLTLDTRWNETLPVQLEMSIDTPSRWMNGEDTQYQLKLRTDGNRFAASSEGTLRPASANRELAAEGGLKLSSPSLRKLGDALGVTILPATMKGEGKLELSSGFRYGDDVASLNTLQLELDTIRLTGDGGAKLGGKRPLITANLEAPDVLKLDDFMPRDAGGNAGKATEKPDTAKAEGGWSREPLMEDTSALTAVDADIALKIGGLKVDDMLLGAMEIRATLNNGTLNLRIPQFAFYDGTAAVDATIRATGKNSLALRKDATMRNANIGAFLRDAHDFDRLSGHGDMKLIFDTQGSSMHELMERLNGNGNFHLRNGAIRGINLAQTVRNARNVVQKVQAVRNQGGTDATAAETQAEQDATAQADGKTDFSEFSASYTINSGILSNRDLSLKAPLMNVTGQGTVDIPRQTVDYRLRPALVGSIEGEGRAQQTGGELVIPIKVSGTFDALRFTPDAGGAVQELLSDPKGAAKNLEQNFRGLRDDVKSLFR